MAPFKRIPEQEHDKPNPKRQKVTSQDEQTVIGGKSKRQKSKRLRKRSVSPCFSETDLMNGNGTSISCSRTHEKGGTDGYCGPCLQRSLKAKALQTSLDPQPVITSCKDKKETSFTPEKIRLSTSLLYRFRSSKPGVFRCSSTGLIFVTTKEAELQYRIIQWNAEQMQSSGRTPAGPLYDIECPEGAVCELHLPHCEPESADLSQSQLSVAHFSENDVEFIKPEQITQSHVVIKVSTLSPFGLTAPSGESSTVEGQVLLFRTPRKWKVVILDVFLLPSNIPVDEVMSKLRTTTEYISAPSTCDHDLVIDQFYSVVCSSAEEIEPKSKRFRRAVEPNYHPLFQLRFSKKTTKALLKVQKTGDNSKEGELWSHTVHLKDPACPVRKIHQRELVKDKLETLRPKFVENVSETNLNQLLDKLEAQKYLNSVEVETVRGKSRADKARDVFDIIKKGNSARLFFINTYCKLDRRSDLSDRMRKILSET